MTSADGEKGPGAGHAQEPTDPGLEAQAPADRDASDRPADETPAPVQDPEPLPPDEHTAEDEVADGTPAGPGGTRVERLLQAILGELRTQTGKTQYEEFSIWNLFAGLSQVLVFLSLFLWYLEGHADKLHYLLLAVVLQLMALTFFSAGRN